MDTSSSMLITYFLIKLCIIRFSSFNSSNAHFIFGKSHQIIIWIQNHWVDTKCNSNCFFVDAKNLTIADENPNNYNRSRIKEKSTTVDVAELKGVCWLDVGGKFDTANLSLNTTYEVAFVIKLKKGYLCEIPLKVRLIGPNGNEEEREENFLGRQTEEWIDILVGEYPASSQRTGEIEFSIYEKSDQHWKIGLVIKGVAIRPKDQKDGAEKSNSECFFLEAKTLSIAWAEAKSNRYWDWSTIESDTVVDIIKQIEVSSLDVSGKFDTIKLSAAGTITYEVAFQFKLEEEKKRQVSGLEAQVKVELILPDGYKQQRIENLMKNKPRGEWMEISVGEFVASPLRTGEIKVSICGRKNSGGLIVIKGIAIRPMYEILE